MRNIIFVSDIFTPYSTRSSTQLVNYSIINFLKQENCFCVGLYDNRSDVDKIKKFFEDESINFSLVKSKFNVEEHNNFVNLLNYYRGLIFPKHINCDKIILPFEDVDKIVVSVPSLEAAYLGISLKERFPNAQLIAIWTDVIAYNFLDDLKEISTKRKMLRRFEKYVLKKADISYFLGDPQRDFQKRAYPKYSSKMHSYHPSFYPYKGDRRVDNSKNIALYFGNMNKKIRDLSGLIESGNYINNCQIRIIGTDNPSFSPITPKNVSCLALANRICDLNEAMKIECDANISICFMNKKGFSLPGKIFYYSDLMRPIIIIRDGSFSAQIEDYLSQFNRFVFCDNSADSISKTIIEVIKNYQSYSSYNKETFSPKNSYSFIIKENKHE